MKKGTLRTVLILIVASLVLLSGCARAPEIVEKQVVVEKPVVQTVVVEKQVEKVVVETVLVEKQVAAPTEPAAPAAKAKYVFLFIGDGMGVAQRNAAELFKAATESTGARPESTKLLMNTFPAQGMNTTYDLTSVIPDSASTATAMAAVSRPPRALWAWIPRAPRATRISPRSPKRPAARWASSRLFRSITPPGRLLFAPVQARRLLRHRRPVG